MLLHSWVSSPQAMYQLAPDEERRDCGLNVLDTYFNNGVSFCLNNPFKLSYRMNSSLYSV